MRKKVIKLILYKNLTNILNGKKSLKTNKAVSSIIDRLYQILSKKEPDYSSLFEKVKSGVKEQPDFAYGEFSFTPKEKTRGKNYYIRRALTTAAAAIIITLLTINYAGQLSLIIKGHKRNANPEIVAKLTEVYNRNKATLIIDDSLQIGLQHDSAIFDIPSKIASNYTYTGSGPKEEDTLSSEGKVTINTIMVPKGGEFWVTLPDKSKVFLNSNSKLTFPSRFDAEKREVSLEGEAMFEVTKAAIPFRVNSGNSITTVLGTVFNIKSAGITDEVTLCSGSVKVSNSGTTNSRILTPEQQASVSGSDISVQKIDIKEVLAWTEGKYYFRNIPLEEIAVKLYDWYNIDFQFASDKIKSVPFTGMINRNSNLKTIFELFEMSYKLNFTVADSCIIINGIHNHKPL